MNRLGGVGQKIRETSGALNSGSSGWGSEWNRRFLEFYSEILGVPLEVGLNARKSE